MMDETDKANLDKFKPISESTEYLVKEIDSFYEAFPLRRGQFIEVTLAKLFAMWSGIATNDESSYNKIGAACGEQK